MSTAFEKEYKIRQEYWWTWMLSPWVHFIVNTEENEGVLSYGLRGILAIIATCFTFIAIGFLKLLDTILYWPQRLIAWFSESGDIEILEQATQESNFNENSHLNVLEKLNDNSSNLTSNLRLLVRSFTTIISDKELIKKIDSILENTEFTDYEVASFIKALLRKLILN
ncbi:MAG: hypothetical protein H0T84_01220, partial [Tatlockia sp.]|nr:hypothetical protein [Tatlockia sp.]